MTISWEEFEKVDIRAGTVVAVHEFPDAKKPAYKLEIDFGELGIKRSSAQITELYTREELLGRQIIAVANFAPKRIAGFLSEVLVTGFTDSEGRIVLAGVSTLVPNGSKLL